MTSENLRGRMLPLAYSAGCLAALLALASGCGTSAYSEQFDKRLVELQKVSAFAALAKPTDHLPVNLRAPLSMVDPTHVYNLYSANPGDASKYVDRDRALPPFMLDGVGYRMTFEGKYSVNVTNSSPYFLYVWLFDAAKSKDGLIALRNLLREKLQDPKADWESVEVRTPEGKTLPWKRLHLKGQQQFDVLRNNSAEQEPSSGIFELWYFEAPGWDVLLGWRATDEAWDKAKSVDTKLSELPEIVAGTIKFKDDETRAKKPAPPSRTWVIGPVSAAPVIPGNGPATPPNATTPNGTGSNGAGPPADSASVHIGSASEWQGHPYSFTPPTGWTRQGNDPVVTFMQAGATPGSLPEVMAISMRQQPETVPSNQLFRQTENDIAAKMQEFQMGPNGSVSVGDMKGESREVNGKENGLPRKMILYMVRKGAVMMIFQGIFNEENYKAMRPVFDEFVKSFHFDGSSASSEIVGGNAVADAAGTAPPEVENVPDLSKLKTVEAKEFFDSMPRDAAEANKAVKGEWIALKGKVVSVGNDVVNNPYVMVGASEGPAEFVFQCVFPKAEAPSLRSLRYADPIVIAGIPVGKFRNEIAMMTRSRFLERPANPPPVYIGTSAEWEFHPYRIMPPEGWTRLGREPVVSYTTPSAPPGALPELMSVSWRQPPDNIELNTVFRETENEIAARLQDFQMGLNGDVPFDVLGMHGVMREVDGKENGIPRKMIVYLYRKGSVLVTFEGIFNADNYKTLRPVFDQFVKSFRLRPGGVNAETSLADAVEAEPPAVAPPDRQRGRGPAPAAEQPNLATPPVANVPAAGPAAGPAAPPEKQGPVQIEFQDKVSASIEFPAGFQHNGKAPEASTVPPMTNEPGAVATPPDTIKIQVAKLGPGVNYNELRRDSINSETQGSTNNKILERGSCNIGGTSGDSLVVWISAGNTGGNETPRRHLVYLANNTAKRLAIKVTADIADANFKQRKEEMIKCLKTLKFD